MFGPERHYDLKGDSANSLLTKSTAASRYSGIVFRVLQDDAGFPSFTSAQRDPLHDGRTWVCLSYRLHHWFARIG